MALENKLGITDSIELAHREEQLTKKRAQELYDKHSSLQLLRHNKIT